MQLIFGPLTEKGNSTALDSGHLRLKWAVCGQRESDIPGLEHESESESHLCHRNEEITNNKSSYSWTSQRVSFSI